MKEVNTFNMVEAKNGEKYYTTLPTRVTNGGRLVVVEDVEKPSLKQISLADAKVFFIPVENLKGVSLIQL